MAANPVLAAGEPGIELDTGKQKNGDGVKTWNDLEYTAAKGDPGPAGVADDASVAQQVASGPETVAALSATYVGIPGADERTVYVTPRGSDANDGFSLKTAKLTIPAALSSLGGSGVIQLGHGAITLASAIALSSGHVVRGAGSALTTINYTGNGKAFTSAALGVRSYLWRLSDFTLNGPGNAVAGTVGIDLDSVSSAHISNVEVKNFEKGFRLYSAQSGYAVYNRFTNCNAQQNSTGYSFEGLGANANIFDRCRANLNTVRGVSIIDSNNNTFIAPQIESNAVGVFIDATSNALADFNMFFDPRFEANTSAAWIVNSANVRDAQILYPQAFGTYVFTDNGTRTATTGYVNAPQKAFSVTANAAGSWRHERTVAGGAELPAFVVRDSNTGSGTPVQYQAENERGGGSLFRGKHGTVVRFDVTARGAVIAGDYTTATRPTSGMMAGFRPGGQVFDTTLGIPIWWNGTGWVNATGTAV